MAPPEQSQESGRPDQIRPSRFERWTRDWNDEPIAAWDEAAHAEWCEKWAPPCPDGSRQRLRRALGFRERNVGELELRVPIGRDDHGACQLIVDEREDGVYVRVLVCCYEEDDEAAPYARDYLDCPVRAWLDRALGDRPVIDVDSDEELPLYTPRYLNGVLQPDHGYRPANRHRRADNASERPSLSGRYGRNATMHRGA